MGEATIRVGTPGSDLQEIIITWKRGFDDDAVIEGSIPFGWQAPWDEALQLVTEMEPPFDIAPFFTVPAATVASNEAGRTATGLYYIATLVWPRVEWGSPPPYPEPDGDELPHEDGLIVE